MPKLLHLEIITPRQTVFVGDITGFTAPGSLGRFEILTRHTAYISSIVIGMLGVRLPDGKQIFYAESGGFVEVFRKKITCLAESCEEAGTIDVVRAKGALERGIARQDGPIPMDQERCLKSIQRARNRLRIAERYGTGTR